MIFFLCKTLVDRAKSDVWERCYHPEHAAYGKVAEPRIINLCEDALGVKFQPYNSVLLPPEHREKLGLDRRHDGLVFIDSVFRGVNETKLFIHYDIKIPDGERDILRYCIDNGLQYILSAAMLTSKLTYECEYLGHIDLARHTDIITKTGKIYVQDFRKLCESH